MWHAAVIIIIIKKAPSDAAASLGLLPLLLLLLLLLRSLIQQQQQHIVISVLSLSALLLLLSLLLLLLLLLLLRIKRKGGRGSGVMLLRTFTCWATESVVLVCLIPFFIPIILKFSLSPVSPFYAYSRRSCTCTLQVLMVTRWHGSWCVRGAAQWRPWWWWWWCWKATRRWRLFSFFSVVESTAAAAAVVVLVAPFSIPTGERASNSWCIDYVIIIAYEAMRDRARQGDASTQGGGGGGGGGGGEKSLNIH